MRCFSAEILWGGVFRRVFGYSTAKVIPENIRKHSCNKNQSENLKHASNAQQLKENFAKYKQKFLIFFLQTLLWNLNFQKLQIRLTKIN